jgi:hypothetical protein
MFRFTSSALALTAASVPALATMPSLSDPPKTRTPQACKAWARHEAFVNEDAREMWGTLDTGETDPKVAVDRLTDDCLGKPVPDIVYFGSSAGFAETYCQKHKQQKICSNLNNTQDVDQTIPLAFIYSLYSCTKDACKKNVQSYEAYLSKDTAALLNKAKSLQPNPDDPEGCFDPAIQLGNNAGLGPSKVEIEAAEPPPDAQSHFSVSVTLTIDFGDSNVGKPKLRYYLVREHGLWFIDDIVSESDSLVDDLKSCR